MTGGTRRGRQSSSNAGGGGGGGGGRRKKWSQPLKPKFAGRDTTQRSGGAGLGGGSADYATFDGVDLPEWQPTGPHTGAIRGMRPDITPISNIKNYNFRAKNTRGFYTVPKTVKPLHSYFEG